MKKLIVLITLLSTLITTGCTQAKNFKIEYENLTDEQSQLLTLTGNRVLKYNLKNLPNDKTYTLKLVYEVYKNNEKIKEEDIFGMAYQPTKENLKDIILAINIQDNKIRCISGESGSIYSTLNIAEDIQNLSYQYFTTSTNINLGDEIYLFHGLKGEDPIRISDLGIISSEDKNSFIKNNELNVFIKLVCEKNI